jgi:phosphate transport system permease protein
VSTEPRKRKRRARTTSPTVLLMDRLSRFVITLGGIGTIVAVTTMCLFLVWVVVPLFLAPSVGAPVLTQPRPDLESGRPCAVGTDEYQTIGWSCSPAGEIRSFRLDDGQELSLERPLAGNPPSAIAIWPEEGQLTFAFSDGTIRAGRLGFRTSFLEPGELAPELAALEPGETARHGAGILERTPTGQFRFQELSVELMEPTPAVTGHAIRLLDQVGSTSAPIHATLADDGVLRLSRATRRKNLLTGKESLSLVQGEVSVELPAGGTLPRWLLLSGLGDNVFLAWEDGSLWRIDARDLGSMRVAEKLDLLPEEGAGLTALGFLIGRTSLVAGDTLGRVRVWFRTKPANAGTIDGAELKLAHDLPGSGAAVSALAPSTRGRMLAAGYADGHVRLFHVTSGKTVLSAALPGEPAAVAALALAPKDDALLAAGPTATALWRLDAPHPETTLAAIFRPVWYEGYESPEHVWQSSSGTDDFEPKYGIVPLVFGTIKATFYSLLFGVPLALLAAIYTSEFMHPRHKARVKPTIEVMASLPSVVLGFLSALVIAPLVEGIVPSVLLALFTLPGSVLLGAYLWRLLPTGWSARPERLRLVSVGACLLAGLAVAGLLGPAVERWFFSGDIRQWLTGSVGTGTGGWMLLLTPVACCLVAAYVIQRVNPWLVQRCEGRSRARFAALDLSKFLCGALGTLALVWTLAALLDALGLDPRGGVLDTYVQRNALVVGFIMGFAIIPIIYTISEDALSAVPDHLRAASLGAGATPWQTALRVIVPTAMSGLFSAIMIGFGRAVGETMIVLMAAGNTPIMDWNVFNGFRTLSANIAVELPEAVQDSTHYRMLFLAALVLFVLTFVLNTAAELVRLRYRRRSVQL